MSYIDIPKILAAAQAQAPSYWYLTDDGAPMRCTCCEELYNGADMFYTFTPNGEKSVTCKDCIDEDWLAKAKNLGTIPF